MTTTYDLTASGSSTTIDGVVFQTVDLAPTGTGIFNSFLVIQDNPTEEGFNTDFSPLPLDDKQPSHTNALLLSSLQIVKINGVDSYAFKLDANEPNSSSGIIDLTSLKIYSATTGNVATLGALGTPLYDMDAGGDVTVSLNAGSDAPAGSGKGDLFVYIPVSKFAGASPYVYLYSAFGGTAASNGGFEEWGATVGPNTPTPHATISGTKWIDADGNLGTAGDQTAGVGWTIFIDDNHNGTLDNGELSTTTDVNGAYTFTGLDAGTYDIREVVQSGWTQLGTNPNPSTVTVTIDGSASVDFYNFQNFSIGGTKFEDLTGDGKSADDKAWSYAPVTIYIEDDGVAGFTAGDHRFTTTDASGNWKISGLTLADVGKKIYEVVPGGSEQTGTLVQTVDNPGGGGTDTGNDFTNFRNYTISGTKFEDLTGDGKSADDKAWSYAPVTIYIEDDGVAGFTAGDHRFTTTDASGNWSISGLTLADVGKKIYEVVPAGSEQTGTLVQTVDNPGSGGTDTGNDFTNFRNYSISGTKYEDLTGNGKSADDTPWSHAAVTIYIEDDGVAGFTAGDHRFTTTDASGNWSIGGLTLADVGKSIYEVVPGDSKQTGTLVQTVENPGSGGTDAHNDFTNFVLFDISGTKYKDITGDGITNDDTGLAGIKIFIDQDNNGVLNWTDLNSNSKWDAGEGDRWTTTDANGHYSFTDLDYTYAGDKVYEVVPSGYVQTAGIGGYAIVGTSGHDQTTGMDFANFQFKPAAELTQGYWSNHTEAWDGKAGLGKTTSANDVPAEANPRTDGYLLLGDLNHNGVADGTEVGHTLLVDLKAAQAIEAGATGGDARTIMLAQAIATQLDINNGFNKYGTGNLEPHNVITEAVDWLKASGGVLADGTLSGQGTVSKAGVLSGGEWGTSGNQFYLGSGTKTWGGDQTINGVTGINGEDIKNALMWFNQNQLVVSQDGNAVAWNDNGTLENVHTNAMDNFWLTLHEQNLV